MARCLERFGLPQVAICRSGWVYGWTLLEGTEHCVCLCACWSLVRDTQRAFLLSTFPFDLCSLRSCRYDGGTTTITMPPTGSALYPSATSTTAPTLPTSSATPRPPSSIALATLSPAPALERQSAGGERRRAVEAGRATRHLPWTAQARAGGDVRRRPRAGRPQRQLLRADPSAALQRPRRPRRS